MRRQPVLPRRHRVVPGGGLLSTTFGGTNSVSSVFYTYDGNGNVSELVNTNGAVVAHYEYDAFGNTATGDKAEANPFRFSTKYLDTETADNLSVHTVLLSLAVPCHSLWRLDIRLSWMQNVPRLP